MFFSKCVSLHFCYRFFDVQSTLDISNCQGTYKFVRDIKSSTYQVVILCKLIRMGLIVLFEISRVRLIEYARYRDSTVIYIYIYIVQGFESNIYLVFTVSQNLMH